MAYCSRGYKVGYRQAYIRSVLTVVHRHICNFDICSMGLRTQGVYIGLSNLAGSKL